MPNVKRKKLHAPLSRVNYYSFGVRVGYWPCLEAPFVEFTLGVWKWQIWYGLKSYKEVRP